jgi:hypothetical protein
MRHSGMTRATGGNMAKRSRGANGTMTQSVPGFGPRGTASADEVAWGHSKRAECGSVARMREVSRTLLGPCSTLNLSASEAEEVTRAGRMLGREADRWEAEGTIDCT